MLFLCPVALIRDPTGDIAKKLGRKQIAALASGVRCRSSPTRFLNGARRLAPGTAVLTKPVPVETMAVRIRPNALKTPRFSDALDGF
jgi:hypothetical protein